MSKFSLFFLCLASVYPLFAGLTYINHMPFIGDWRNVTEFQEKTYVLDRNGRLITIGSDNSFNKVELPTISSVKFTGMATDGTAFVVSGSDGSSLDESFLLISSDGSVWEVYSVGYFFSNINYLLGKFMSLDTAGGINWSEDLVNWNRTEINADDDLLDVTFFQNRWYVMGSSNLIYYSDDLTNWETMAVTNNLDEPIQFERLYSNSAVIYFYSSTWEYVYRSFDGENWEFYEPQFLEYNMPFESIELNEIFINTPLADRVDISIDNGVSWYVTELPTDSLRWSNPYLHTYDDRWGHINFSKRINETVYFGGNDGQLWTLNLNSMKFEQLLGSVNAWFYSADKGNSKYVAVGKNDHLIGREGRIYVSELGLDWVDVTPVESAPFQKVIFEENIFVAIASPETAVDKLSAQIWISNDGLEWTNTSPWNVSGELSALVYKEGIFYAVSPEGNLFSSGDGKTWARTILTQAFSGADVNDIVFFKDQIFVGSSEGVFSSSDLNEWENEFAAQEIVGFSEGQGFLWAYSRNAIYVRIEEKWLRRNDSDLGNIKDFEVKDNLFLLLRDYYSTHLLISSVDLKSFYIESLFDVSLLDIFIEDNSSVWLFGGDGVIAKVNDSNSGFSWENQTFLNDGWKNSSWLELYNDSYYPYIYNENFGWVYSYIVPSFESNEGVWLYKVKQAQWLWTSQDIFPIVWNPVLGSWGEY